MVYGNRNRTGVCGTWQRERELLANTPPARLRADAGFRRGPRNASERRWRWEHTADDLRVLRAHADAGGSSDYPNQQVRSCK